MSENLPRADKSEITGWKNPYILYIALTTGLFAFLVIIGWVAWSQDWIPHR